MKTYVLWAVGASLLLSAAMSGGIIVEQSASGGMPSSISANAAPTPSNARIRIVSPRDNAIVPLGQNRVQIATENIGLEAAHNWRLYMDGVLIDTIASGVVTYTLPISESGPHEIKATLSNSENVDLASATIEVTAAPETPTSSPFNLSWVAPTMGVFVIGVVALLVFSLRMTRRKGEG